MDNIKGNKWKNKCFLKIYMFCMYFTKMIYGKFYFILFYILLRWSCCLENITRLFFQRPGSGVLYAQGWGVRGFVEAYIHIYFLLRPFLKNISSESSIKNICQKLGGLLTSLLQNLYMGICTYINSSGGPWLFNLGMLSKKELFIFLNFILFFALVFKFHWIIEIFVIFQI